jgi:hypothetical protein
VRAQVLSVLRVSLGSVRAQGHHFCSPLEIVRSQGLIFCVSLENVRAEERHLFRASLENAIEY